LQQLDHQPLDGRLVVDFLRGQAFCLEQGVNSLVIFAPLPEPLGNIQQVVATALQRRKVRGIDRLSLLDGPAGVAQFDGDRRLSQLS
jgi:hypothetical protein